MIEEFAEGKHAGQKAAGAGAAAALPAVTLET